MNKEQKAALVDDIATQIKDANAVFAVDYRGISVPQAAELRTRLGEAGATLRIVKNTLTTRAAEKAGADSLKEVLEGPTAFTFVRGDAALAAKALATFRREHDVLEFKGGTMDGDTLTVEEIQSIARLPGRDALQGQFVAVLASPVTGLVRGLGSLIQGLAIQLKQVEEQGLVSGGAPAEKEPAAAGGDEPAAEEAAVPEDQQADEAEAEAPAEEAAAPEAEETDQADTETPSEGETDESKEG
jgi:large subunit ribosomal protein L10